MKLNEFLYFFFVSLPLLALFPTAYFSLKLKLTNDNYYKEKVILSFCFPGLSLIVAVIGMIYLGGK